MLIQCNWPLNWKDQAKNCLEYPLKWQKILKNSQKTPNKHLKIAKKWPKYHSNHQNYHPIEAPRKIPSWISENIPKKTCKMSKKCHKIAITIQNICQKNHFFSPIKIWSKWSLKIAPKPSVLRKKLIKATLKYIDWRAFCTYWLWSGCWGSARNLAAKIVKICVFLNFWKNEKWLSLNRKISVTKVQK